MKKIYLSAIILAMAMAVSAKSDPEVQDENAGQVTTDCVKEEMVIKPEITNKKKKKAKRYNPYSGAPQKSAPKSEQLGNPYPFGN